MRKLILYIAVIAVIAAANMLPFNGMDVGKLYPVEVLALQCEEEVLYITTDSGLVGCGTDIHQAFHDLKCGAPGEIFLDTVNYVLLSPDCLTQIYLLYPYLRLACQVYLLDGEGELTDIGAYLECHSSGVTILNCMQDEVDIPRLLIQDEVYRIVE